MPRNFSEALEAEPEVIDFPKIKTASEAPLPLRRELREADPYPVSALGELMGQAVSAAASIISAPLALCAQSALANAALAVQGQANAVKPWSGKAGPISLFLLSIAESGDRKSTADDALGGDAIEEHESSLEDDYGRERQRFENEREGYEMARTAIKAKANKDGEPPTALADRLQELGGPPSPPLSPSLKFGDPTIEGVHKHFASGQPSSGLFSTEGGAFVGGVGMSADNALKTSAQLSELWDGAPIKRLRAGDGAMVLRNRRLSFHLMMQPGAAHQWLSNPVIRDQGLFSRMLVAAPKSLAGSRFHKAVSADERTRLAHFNRHLITLLEHPLPVDPERRGELRPRALPLDADAEAVMWEFYNSIEAQSGADGALAPVKGLAGKTTDHAVRLAAVIGLFENPALESINDALMRRGIKVAQWYLGEALRLTEAEAFPPDLVNAEKTLDWLKSKEAGDVFSLPCLYMKGPRPVRHKETAAKVISILLDHKQIEKVDGSHRVDGHSRRDCYRLRDAA